MNKKIYVILIILLLIAMVLGGVFWYLIKNQNKNQAPVIVPSVDQEAKIVLDNKPATTTETSPIVPKATEEQKEKAQLAQLASAFSERLGSYSNQSNYENLIDLKPFMSVDLQKWADDYINNSQINAGTVGPYFGLTTKALKTEMVSFDESQAIFKVSTQRHEVMGADFNDRVYYQDLELEMIKEGEVWVVDKFTWK